MGWNSWNAFRCDIDGEQIREVTDALVESSMREAGYEFVTLDDCWMAHERTDEDELVGNPERFPRGMAALGDYVHERGFAYGIYQSAGTFTCAHRYDDYPTSGSLTHEQADAETFADWGVDFLKYDNCGDHLDFDARERYRRMWDALDATGRSVVKSQCSWGEYEEWEWAREVGAHTWRTTTDIHDTWDSVLAILDQQVGLAEHAGPGGWNDPDMLQVGNDGLTTSESRAHFSLWCVLAAPLFAGNDVREMDAATRDILTNEAAIAVNQDPAGVQGTRRKRDGDGEVWAKPLADGDVAVCLLNRGESTREVELGVDQLALPDAAAYECRDLWTDEAFAVEDVVGATVPGHDVAFYRVGAA